EQVTEDGPAREADVGSGGEYRTGHRDADPGPDQAGEPSSLPDRDQPLPHRLGRDERGRGGDAGELGARYPGGEVGRERDTREQAHEYGVPTRPAHLGPAGRHRQRYQHGGGESVAPQGD